MGFRYRKSINLGGGFRINISKSGIGYSWGVKGYRVTKTAKGTVRTTASIPGTGISFVEETRQNGTGTPQPTPRSHAPIDNNHYDTQDIVNGTATDMVSDGLQEILSAARKAMTLNTAATVGLCISWIIPPLFFLFLILKIYVRTSGRVNLEYVIDEDQREAISQRMDPMLRVTECQKVWRIMQSSKVIDKKYSAGASNTVKRIACKVSRVPPFPFKSDTQAASFKSGKETLVFLPDKLFLIQGNKIGALSYSDLSTSAHVTRFIEEEGVPKDASIVGRTWKYVNKSGGPDRRFKNNRELPVCLYGELELRSLSGLNTILMFSNADLK